MQQSMSIAERSVSAVRFELQGDDDRFVVVWRGVTHIGVCLADSKKSWLTSKAGDAIIVNGQRETISAVELDIVNPVYYRDLVVTSAADWLAGR